MGAGYVHHHYCPDVEVPRLSYRRSNSSSSRYANGEEIFAPGNEVFKRKLTQDGRAGEVKKIRVVEGLPKEQTEYMKTPKLGNFDGLYVDYRGRSGGLTLLWEKSVNAIVMFCSSHGCRGGKPKATINALYGDLRWPEIAQKSKTYEMIRNIQHDSSFAVAPRR
ncbi:hypothetical protein Cgig2_005227 [Carnegiea gigantea]|uniref:Uncharacterized protein n=1 Tax=Carnegiea gigantea TaxID=171969 RepID=A0A9Q1QBN6_9CARY|nr:hypothetical protein Cgig2_005227 [Carnegiea gigantea]